MEGANKENAVSETQDVQAAKGSSGGEAVAERSALQESNVENVTTQSTEGAVQKETAPKIEDQDAGAANQITEKKPKKEPDFFKTTKATSLQDHFNRFRKAKK